MKGEMPMAIQAPRRPKSPTAAARSNPLANFKSNQGTLSKLRAALQKAGEQNKAGIEMLHRNPITARVKEGMEGGIGGMGNMPNISARFRQGNMPSGERYGKLGADGEDAKEEDVGGGLKPPETDMEGDDAEPMDHERHHLRAMGFMARSFFAEALPEAAPHAIPVAQVQAEPDLPAT